MEENTTPSEKYTKAFNDGYLLGKHEPVLAEKLTAVEPISEVLSGLQDGIKQSRTEKIKEMAKVQTKGSRPVEKKEVKDKGREEMDRE